MPLQAKSALARAQKPVFQSGDAFPLSPTRAPCHTTRTKEQTKQTKGFRQRSEKRSWKQNEKESNEPKEKKQAPNSGSTKHPSHHAKKPLSHQTKTRQKQVFYSIGKKSNGIKLFRRRNSF